MKKLAIGYMLGMILMCLTVNVNAQRKGPEKRKTPVLNHIALYVVDLKKATAFYQDIIRIDTIPEPFHDGKHTWFSIGDHSHLHLIQGAKKMIGHDKNTHLCFSVPSLEEIMERLDKAKIEYENWAGTGKTPTIRVDGVKQIYLRDPDGYWVELNNDKY